MRKGMWLAAAVVVLLSAAGAALTVSAAVAAGNTVTMKDLYFEPADISVAVNTPVVFHNGSGSIEHDAKAEDGSFSTALLKPGTEQTVTLTKVGDIKYYCTVEGHRSAGMEATIHVTAAGATPPPAAASTTTTTAATATTATTAAGQTTTTTRAGANAAGQSTTTTTAPVAGGATSTTQAPSVTPTSAPEGGSTATTAAAPEQAEAGHASEGAQKKKEKNNPVGIAFAAVSTVLLMGIAGKLLASKP